MHFSFLEGFDLNINSRKFVIDYVRNNNFFNEYHNFIKKYLSYNSVVE